MYVAKRMTPELDHFIKETAKTWRTARRANDLHTATLILQVVVSAIPHKSGRVAEWLGPTYFDEEVPLVTGCPVRILREQDKVTFRNPYKYSALVRGKVNVVGNDYCEISVREKFGLKVVIRNREGAEQVLSCGELRRNALNPHKNRDDPAVSLKYHTYNRKHTQRVQVGTAVEYMTDKGWVKTKVLRLIRGENCKDVVYTVSKDRVINSLSVKLSPRAVKRARHHNKLWYVIAVRTRNPDPNPKSKSHHNRGTGLTKPIVTVMEREVIKPETYKHLRVYIFSNTFLETLKASEQNTRRGHCFALRERATTTLPRYRADAKAKGITPVSEKVYRRALSSKVFTNYRKDHTMCKTCLRSGWRGIWDKGRQLLKDMQAKPCWVTTTRGDGTQQVLTLNQNRNLNPNNTNPKPNT